jgi:hypothetical protein
MTDVNPYEPPRELEPLTTGQRVKQALGIATIVLLTPPALVVAGATSCAVTYITRRYSPIETFLSTMVPLATLTAIVIWTYVDRCRKHPEEKVSLTIFLSTPTFFAGGMAIGLVLGWFLYVVVGNSIHNQVTANVVSVVVFWTVPAIVLTAVLWKAWRAAKRY